MEHTIEHGLNAQCQRHRMSTINDCLDIPKGNCPDNRDNTMQNPITPDNFTRINNDVNGNPRHVCHFLHLDVHGWQSNIGLSDRYAIACKLANSIGGKKYHNKQYGGGIVFQEYAGCLDSLSDRINALTQLEGVAA